nr:MAG TPA: hypothetical protein [Caudoviricetes sp.]
MCGFTSLGLEKIVAPKKATVFPFLNLILTFTEIRI